LSTKTDTLDSAVEFGYNDEIPEDEVRYLLLRLLEQSMKDYMSLGDNLTKNNQEYFDTAESFLFDKEHYVQWGEYEINCDFVLEYLDIDEEWFYKKLEVIKIEKQKERLAKKKKRCLKKSLSK